MMRLGSLSIEVVTLFVKNLHDAKSFYQEIFGLSIVYEDEDSVVFDFANMSINLLVYAAASDLISPKAVANQEAGSRFQFTIRVDDVDGVCSQLIARGVTLINGPMNRLWGVRTASFSDPDGHIWEIAQQLT